MVACVSSGVPTIRRMQMSNTRRRYYVLKDGTKVPVGTRDKVDAMGIHVYEQCRLPNGIRHSNNPTKSYIEGRQANCYLSIELHELLKQYAAERRLSVSAAVRGILIEKLVGEKK
jgi:hypothetical protein